MSEDKKISEKKGEEQKKDDEQKKDEERLSSALFKCPAKQSTAVDDDSAGGGKMGQKGKKGDKGQKGNEKEDEDSKVHLRGGMCPKKKEAEQDEE